MVEKLLDFARASTEIVERDNYQYYWEAQGYKFNNLNLARWYEKEFNCWATFVARQLPEFRKNLEDKTLDMNRNYDLECVQQLKKDYDYIRLLFSGGYDSAAVFLTFVENGIFIDETVTRLYSSVENEINTEDLLPNITPLIDQYKTLVGKTTFKETSFEQLHNLWSDEYVFFNSPNANPQPLCIGEVPLNLEHYEYKANSCFIKCIDKPQLVHYNNKWYVVALDSTFGSFIGLPNLIYFWLDARNVKGLLKHARLYREYLLNNVEITKSLQFFKFYAQEELNYVIERPSIPNPGKKMGKREKAHLQRTSMIDNNRYDIANKYARCMETFHKIFPETLEGFNDYNNKGKFAWLIDIDSLEIFTQQELIPNGFDVNLSRL